MKSLFTLAFLFLLTACSTLPGKGPMTAYLEAGPSTLDQDDLMDTSEERTATVGVLYHQADSVSSDLSVTYSDGDHSVAGIDLDTQRIALNLGIRYTFALGFFQPYLGAGFSPQVLMAETSAGEDESDFAFGGYGVAGFDILLGKHTRLGLNYRHSFNSQFDLGTSDDLNFNAGTVSAVLGWSF